VDDCHRRYARYGILRCSVRLSLAGFNRGCALDYAALIDVISNRRKLPDSHDFQRFCSVPRRGSECRDAHQNLCGTRIKICGLTTLADAQHAVDAGADYLGMNFIERSKRCVSTEELLPWWGELTGDVMRVALFQNAQPRDVERVLSQLDFDVLQFHGDESEALCAGFGLPYWKAVRLPVGGSAYGEAFSAISQSYDSAEALLLDAVTVDAAGNTIAGGTGKQFDWALWPQWSDRTLWLAGGLNPESPLA